MILHMIQFSYEDRGKQWNLFSVKQLRLRETVSHEGLNGVSGLVSHSSQGSLCLRTVSCLLA